MNYTDPTGHCPWCIGAVAGGVIGGVAGGIYGYETNGCFWCWETWGDIGIGAGGGALVGGTLGAAAPYLASAAGTVATGTAALASRIVEAGDDVWAMGAAVRGRIIERLLMSGNAGWFGAGNNVPVIDAYENGVATSVKSMDLAAKTYQSAGGITGMLTKAIDRLAGYTGNTYVTANGTTSFIGNVMDRVLNVGIPSMKLTGEQQQALQDMASYAAQQGVKLIYTVVK